MTLTSLMKSSGAVLIGRDSGSSSGALWSCMKEALGSSRLGSPECSFRIFLLSLGFVECKKPPGYEGAYRLDLITYLFVYVAEVLFLAILERAELRHVITPSGSSSLALTHSHDE